MNQILVGTEKNDSNENIHLNFFTKKKKKTYLVVFVTSVLICIFLIIYLLCSYFSKLKQKKMTEIIKNNYNISSLYPTTNNYNAIKLSNSISIIGLLEIPSINISYPILYNSTEELLKISVCRFFRTSS